MKHGMKFADGYTIALVVAVLFVELLTAGCAPGQEAQTRAVQPVGNGQVDTESVTTNAVVGLANPGWCTGTLITSTFVLTAAHCVTNAWSGTGTILVGLTPGASSVYRAIADQCWMHPLAYNTGSSNCNSAMGIPNGSVDSTHDVAILRLMAPVPRSLARPTQVLMAMPSGTATFAGQLATIRGHGVTTLPDGSIGQPATRMWGDTQIDVMGTTLNTNPALPLPDGGVRAWCGSGDSGGPLLWPVSQRPSIIGVASRCNATWSYWTPTTAPEIARWINNVMTDNTTSYISGSTTGPAMGWQGEGADRNGRVAPNGMTLPGDNCPNLFNPWQDDDDGDGFGNECDVCPSGASHATVFDHDADGDGISDECGDNCYGVASTNLADSDGDGWGDVCDLCNGFADIPPTAFTPVLLQQPNCNRNTEIEEGRPALGDRCDPYPCDPVENFNSGWDRTAGCTPTSDPSVDHCVRGSDFVQVGYAPRVGVGASVPWAPTSTASALTSPLWRCVCIRASDNVQLDDSAACAHPVTGACPRDGNYRYVGTGYGWRHAAVDAPGWGMANLGPVWGAPAGELAPNLSYATHGSRSEAAAWWRYQASNAALAPLTFWNWNWAATTETYPSTMPRSQPNVAFVNPPRVALWSRAQPLTDPGTSPTSVSYRVARMQDSYRPDVGILEGVHTLDVNRRRAPLFWNIALRAPPLPVGPFPCPTPLEELVTRYRPRVIPLNSQSPAGASDMFFANGSAGDPTRGIVVALADVRQGTIVRTAATTAVAAADLPVPSNLSFAFGKMDAVGFPEVFAFGGRKADLSLSGALYFTTHTYDASGNVTYKWHRVDVPANLPLRENSTLVASADGQRVYVIGGRNGATVYGDVWRYDLGTMRWMLLALSAAIPARYDATAVAMNDTLYLGGGITTGGGYLGDLLEIDGITGGVMNFGSVLPTGALPDLTFDQHYQGLLYAGGYVGATWYRDLWTVRLTGSTAAATFVHDFGGDGLQPTSNYSLVGDLAHNAFWAVPGYYAAGGAQKVWFLQDGVVSSNGGTAARVATDGSGRASTGSPARRTNPAGTPPAIRVLPTGLTGGVR